MPETIPTQPKTDPIKENIPTLRMKKPLMIIRIPATRDRAMAVSGRGTTGPVIGVRRYQLAAPPAPPPEGFSSGRLSSTRDRIRGRGGMVLLRRRVACLRTGVLLRRGQRDVLSSGVGGEVAPVAPPGSLGLRVLAQGEPGGDPPRAAPRPPGRPGRLRPRYAVVEDPPGSVRRPRDPRFPSSRRGPARRPEGPRRDGPSRGPDRPRGPRSFVQEASAVGRAYDGGPRRARRRGPVPRFSAARPRQIRRANGWT